MTEYYFIRVYGKNEVGMWSRFKDNKFVVDKLLESITRCGGCGENATMASFAKILILVFMK